METTKISKILASDLLSEKSKYVKDSYLIFDRLRIDFAIDKIFVHFYNNNDLLATMTRLSGYWPSAFDFNLIDGKMRIKI